MNRYNPEGLSISMMGLFQRIEVEGSMISLSIKVCTILDNARVFSGDIGYGRRLEYVLGSLSVNSNGGQVI